MDERIINYEKAMENLALSDQREQYANMSEGRPKEIDKLREQFYKKCDIENTEGK